MFAAASSVTPHIKAGRLKALAIADAQPSPLFPGLPPVAATVPGYETGGGTAMLMPRGIPAAVVKRLSQEVMSAMQRPDVKQRFAAAGVETVGSTPQQLGERIRLETGRITKLVDTAGLRE
jgi:tripartite-type tricarboxylate transporter receptor subunit TctC